MKNCTNAALFSKRIAINPIALCLIKPSIIIDGSKFKEEKVGWGLELLNIPHYWEKSKGKGVKVAVLDSGVAEHSNLKGAVVETKNFTTTTDGGIDSNGHGTHCIGIIAANTEGQGMLGVAPACNIYSAKVINNKGGDSINALVRAIHWAIEKEVHIISISMICSYGDEKNIKEAIQLAVEHGIFVVAAVGNEGKFVDAVHFPAKYEEVIAVGAIDEQLNITAYSSQGEGIDLVAPGDNILSTHLDGHFAWVSGTSTAVPFVVGQIALGLSLYFKCTKNKTVGVHYNSLKQLFLNSTIQLGELKKNKIYGAGILDLEEVFRTIEEGEYKSI